MGFAARGGLSDAELRNVQAPDFLGPTVCSGGCCIVIGIGMTIGTSAPTLYGAIGLIAVGALTCAGALGISVACNVTPPPSSSEVDRVSSIVKPLLGEEDSPV